jgi:hypothetical protein
MTSSADPAQGMITVFPGIYYYGAGDLTRFYKTPLRLGTLHIVSIDGRMVKLSTQDPKMSFTFDLATRQWVPPNSQRASGPWTSGLSECRNYQGDSVYQPTYYSCWQGIAAGREVIVHAGRESALAHVDGSAIRPLGDCCTGLLEVANRDTYGEIYHGGIYTTTLKVGALYIISINSSRVKLGSYDPKFKNLTLSFDLDTRRWVNP